MILLSLSIITINSNPVYAREEIKNYVPGQLIISFKPNVNAKDIAGFYDKFSNSYRISEIKSLDQSIQNDYDNQEKLIKVPEGQERKIRNALQKNPNIQNVSFNYLVHIADTFPNDSSFSSLWGLDNTGQTGGTIDSDIDAPKAWDVTKGSHSTIVGIVDTGVEYTHPDLEANIWTNPREIVNSLDDDGNGYADDIHGINTIEPRTDIFGNPRPEAGDPMDDHDHGTHVAGIIGGVGNNAQGIVGVNWNVSIVACKFISKEGSGSFADAIECIEYLKSLKADYGVDVKVVNHSWGGGPFNEMLRDSMLDESEDAILHITAAGNDGQNNDEIPFYPASYGMPNQISVAATDHNDSLASFSNYGSQSVDLGAPGVNILSTITGGNYAIHSGTSMAAPHVTGAIALISSIYPNLTSAQLKDKTIGSVDPNPNVPSISMGRLNVGNAIESDIIAPSQVTTLSVDQINKNSISISFLSTGDDNNSGIAESYDIRYSEQPISESTWPNAIKAIGEPIPKPPGNLEKFEILGLKMATKYFIGIKVIDDVGNNSPLSNIISPSTAGTVLLDDNVESGINNWSTTQTSSLVFWHQTTNKQNSPSHSWYYGNEINHNYDDNTNSGNLTSSLIDLTDASEATLIYSEWIEVEPQAEQYEVDLTKLNIFNGADWINVLNSTNTQGTWRERIIDLTPFVGNQIRIGFEFDSQDGLYNDYEGWYIDDIKVTKYVSSTSNDIDPPVVTVPSDITQSASPTHVDDGGTAVSFSVSADDNVDGVIVPTCTHNSGDLFAVGTTTVTCDATDAAANTSSASFDVTIVDGLPPVVKITNPQAGDISGKILFSADVTGLVGQISVFFFINGNQLGDADTSEPYETSFHTKDYSGDLTLTVEAYDPNGFGSDTIQVTIPAKGGDGGGSGKPCNPNKPNCN